MKSCRTSLRAAFDDGCRFLTGPGRAQLPGHWPLLFGTALMEDTSLYFVVKSPALTFHRTVVAQ